MSLVYIIGFSVEMEAQWLLAFSFYSTVMVKSTPANLLAAHTID